MPPNLGGAPPAPDGGGGDGGDSAAEPGFDGDPAPGGLPPAFGEPTTEAGACVDGPFGRPGAAAAGAVPCCGTEGVTVFALGSAVGAPAAPVGGGGGAPFVPGTGSAFAFGRGWPCGVTAGALAGSVLGAATPLPGRTPPTPGLTNAGLIDALGGTGALPCWISVALCATEGGSAAVAAPGAATGAPPLAPSGAAAAPCPGTGPAPGGGRLITLLITVVLWMLA